MTAESYAIFRELEVRKDEVLNCSFSNWCDQFKDHLPKCAVIKPIPSSFIAYLNEESIHLPPSGHESSDITIDSGDFSDNESVDEAEVPRSDPTDTFSQLHQKIATSIDELGRAVFPKFNWSAPKDASWMMANNSIRCITPAEVYLLFKSSDHIIDDLDHALDECVDYDAQEKVDYEIILKEWQDINPALEFRIFVKARKIIGIAQRDNNFYSYLAPLVPQIKQTIEKFFEEIAKANIPNDNIVIDIYVPRPYSKVWIIDFNPFARKADPLLFTWNELIEFDPALEDYEFRLVEKSGSGRTTKKFSENQVPMELHCASLNPETLADLTREWKHLGLHQDREK